MYKLFSFCAYTYNLLFSYCWLDTEETRIVLLLSCIPLIVNFFKSLLNILYLILNIMLDNTFSLFWIEIIIVYSVNYFRYQVIELLLWITYYMLGNLYCSTKYITIYYKFHRHFFCLFRLWCTKAASRTIPLFIQTSSHVNLIFLLSILIHLLILSHLSWLRLFTLFSIFQEVILLWIFFQTQHEVMCFDFFRRALAVVISYY